jgi:omega-amidase
MQVIGCQLDIAWEDKTTSHARVRELLATTPVAAGALIVLPEMFATGFSMHVGTIAESSDGPTHSFLAQLARERAAYVMGGVVTRAADERGRNDAVVYDPQGALVTRYSKLHPFSYAGETRHYEAGSEVVTFAWHDFRVAPFVCYDLRFPEAFRQAARNGAQLMTVIANWPHPREAHWLALLRARAIENQAYIVGVNRSGSDPHVRYGGRSLILDPRGETLAEAGEAPQVVTANLELAPLVEYREHFPALADMRADLLAE